MLIGVGPTGMTGCFHHAVPALEMLFSLATGDGAS
jgi:hypothetical protein